MSNSSTGHNDTIPPRLTRKFKVANRAFSLTWPASMLIYWNKKKRVKLPEDWFGTLTWPPLWLFWNTNVAAVTSCENALQIQLSVFTWSHSDHIGVPKTMKRRPCLCSELILFIQQLHPIWLNTSGFLIADNVKPLLPKLISYCIYPSF